MAKNTDMISFNLKGKVQQLQETSSTIDSTGKSKMDSVVYADNFDDKGYITSYTERDSAGTIHKEEAFDHDSAGYVTEVKTMSNGKLTDKFVLDVKDGKYVGGKTYDSTGKQVSYYTDLVTNDYGMTTAGKEHFMNGRVKTSWDDKFDGPVFVSGTTIDSTGKISYQGSVKVNDKGDPAEETSTTRDKDSTKTQKMTYKYDNFDDKGNWTQQTTYNEKGKPTKVTRRTLTYYKD
jgi:hypothetical protein